MSSRQWPLPCSEEELLSLHVAGPHSQDKGFPGIITCDPFCSRSSLPLNCSWKRTRGGAGLTQVRPETTSFNRISQVGTMRASAGKQLLGSPGGNSLYDKLRSRLVGQERTAPVRRYRCDLSGHRSAWPWPLSPHRDWVQIRARCAHGWTNSRGRGPPSLTGCWVMTCRALRPSRPSLQHPG